MNKAIFTFASYFGINSVYASIRQRICTDAELALLSLQQSIKGSDFNTCIIIDPQTKLATSMTMKNCLMLAGATELCASCFATINEAFSQCVVKCEASGRQSSDCSGCLRVIQVSYELSDDQMTKWELFDICRTGFANERGEILTTGAPLTTTLPPIQVTYQNDNEHGATKNHQNMFQPKQMMWMLFVSLIISLM